MACSRVNFNLLLLYEKDSETQKLETKKKGEEKKAKKKTKKKRNKICNCSFWLKYE
jgi:hypothetical protein